MIYVIPTFLFLKKIAFLECLKYICRNKSLKKYTTQSDKPSQLNILDEIFKFILFNHLKILLKLAS